MTGSLSRSSGSHADGRVLGLDPLADGDRLAGAGRRQTRISGAVSGGAARPVGDETRRRHAAWTAELGARRSEGEGRDAGFGRSARPSAAGVSPRSHGHGLLADAACSPRPAPDPHPSEPAPPVHSRGRRRRRGPVAVLGPGSGRRERAGRPYGADLARRTEAGRDARAGTTRGGRRDEAARGGPLAGAAWRCGWPHAGDAQAAVGADDAEASSSTEATSPIAPPTLRRRGGRASSRRSAGPGAAGGSGPRGSQPRTQIVESAGTAGPVEARAPLARALKVASVMPRDRGAAPARDQVDRRQQRLTPIGNRRLSTCGPRVGLDGNVARAAAARRRRRCRRRARTP